MNWKANSRWMVAAGLWAAAFSSAFAGGYLPSDGPPPLRYKTPPKAAAARTPLPPLALTTPDTSGSAPEATPSDGTVPDDALSGGGTGTPNQVVAGAGGATPGAGNIDIPPAVLNPLWTPPPLALTPQVLLSYLGNAGTNGVNPVVVAPVSFVPPQPGAYGPAPSSRATYRKVSP